MTKEKCKKFIYLILIIIWMMTVFMFSNQNGGTSQGVSRKVTTIIVQTFTQNQNLTKWQTDKIVENMDYLIRKLAHFSIYALGGILIYNYIYTINIKKKIIISIIIGVVYATFDEFHQYFVAGRSARMLDICIDTLGIVIGVAIIYLIKKPLKN